MRLFWAWLLDWNFGPPEVKVSKWRIGWAAKLYIDHSLYNELQNSNFIQAINVKRNKILDFFRNFSDFQKFSRLFSVITTTTVLSQIVANRQPAQKGRSVGLFAFDVRKGFWPGTQKNFQFEIQMTSGILHTSDNVIGI